MNYRMLIQYDGTRYNGWQRQQSTDMTIQGKIESVLSKMTGKPVEIHGAGRTDAGVHALGQVANVHLDTSMPPAEILRYLNRWLPEDIGILSVEEAPPRFHSRLNAVSKRYDYRIATNPALHVFDRKFMYPFTEPLNVPAMQEAASFLTGEHDFQGFCARKMKKSTVRRLDSVTFAEEPGELCISYRGNGFLYYMVRIMTGTLIEIGTGQRTPESIPSVFETKLREQAGFTAPARGLTLVNIDYQEETSWTLNE